MPPILISLVSNSRRALIARLIISPRLVKISGRPVRAIKKIECEGVAGKKECQVARRENKQDHRAIKYT
jgi:hypothetical protein